MRQLSFIIILILTNSCDCVVDHSGVVIDEFTNQPISDAKVIFDKREYFTNEKGRFEIHYLTGFCPEEKFHVQKKNYKDFILTIDRSSETTNYQVLEDNDYHDKYYTNGNSINFAIKNDTIILYMQKK
jgi:hypothetical protein